MTLRAVETDKQLRHAALWLIGPDMPGILHKSAEFVTQRGGNIDKDIADKFGEKAVVFLSLTAKPEDIARMEHDKNLLRDATGCGVVFQPMSQPTVPHGFQDDLHGVDIITDDVPGLLAELTQITAKFGMFIVGHTGERMLLPGPRRFYQFGQKIVCMLPQAFDHVGFTVAMTDLTKKYNGKMVTPLRVVPGLLWWW